MNHFSMMLALSLSTGIVQSADAQKSKNKKPLVIESQGSFVIGGSDVTEPGMFDGLKGAAIPLSDFMKLTQIPIIVYYGDNIADKPTPIWNKDHWRAGLEMAKIWAATINRHGGDATVEHLPEVGIKGNTHFAFADLNKVEVADHLSDWLRKKELDADHLSVGEGANQ